MDLAHFALRQGGASVPGLYRPDMGREYGHVRRCRGDDCPNNRACLADRLPAHQRERIAGTFPKGRYGWNLAFLSGGGGAAPRMIPNLRLREIVDLLDDHVMDELLAHPLIDAVAQIGAERIEIRRGAVGKIDLRIGVKVGVQLADY